VWLSIMNYETNALAWADTATWGAGT